MAQGSVFDVKSALGRKVLSGTTQAEYDAAVAGLTEQQFFSASIVVNGTKVNQNGYSDRLCEFFSFTNNTENAYVMFYIQTGNSGSRRKKVNGSVETSTWNITSWQIYYT